MENDAQLIELAKGRWLNVRELEYLLIHESTPLPISKSKPPRCPPSGSLFLYDRSTTRNYKDDGYEWIKKRNSPKVREDHVKLRVGGKPIVAGCYVHCSTNLNMHRRAYHLLNPETGSALHPIQKVIKGSGMEDDRRIPSLVLVHYLDTKVASIYSDNVKNSQVRDSSSARTYVSDDSNRHISHSNHSLPTLGSHPSQASHNMNNVLPQFHSSLSSMDLMTPQYSTLPSSSTNYNSDCGMSNNSVNWDSDTLDFLWGIATEECNESPGHKTTTTNTSSTEAQGKRAAIMHHYNHPHSNANISEQKMVNGGEAYHDPKLHSSAGMSTTHSQFVGQLGHQYSNSSMNSGNNPYQQQLLHQQQQSNSAGINGELAGAKYMYHNSHPFQQVKQSQQIHGKQGNSSAAVHHLNPTYQGIAGQQSHVSKIKEENVQQEMEPHSSQARTVQPQQHWSIPEIVDITPERININEADNLKIVISCSSPLLDLPETTDDMSIWHRLAVFVEFTTDDETSDSSSPLLQSQVPTSMTRIDVCKAQRLNPFCCRCVQLNTKVDGIRRAAIIAVLVKSGDDPFSDRIKANILSALQTIWNNNQGRDLSKYDTRSFTSDGISIMLLTHLSDHDKIIHFKSSALTTSSNDSEKGSDTSESHLDPKASAELPAPPPAMALVATVLSDFPNPPVTTVVPPESKITAPTINLDEQNPSSTTPDITTISDMSDGIEAEAILSAALEATVEPHYDDKGYGNRKRTSSFITPNAGVLSKEDDGDVKAAASAWAQCPTSNNPDAETKAEEVDRHCKIRFVERLTDLIAETGTEASTSMETDAQIEAADDTDLKAMDDDKLDNLLDSLLVRIVESLVEMSASSCELQEELNSFDKSGFTLLHYAALYNLQSLIPVLLSRGANPDIRSVRGNLTPLHLACGAGNLAIVQLLVRHGCALQVHDCFGSFPIDHALRNEFPEVCQWMSEKIGNEQDIQDDNRALEAIRARIGDNEVENTRFMLQSAFSNLSLKDKLALNMFRTQKNKHKSKERHSKMGNTDIIMEADDEDAEEGTESILPMEEDCAQQQSIAPMVDVEPKFLKAKDKKRHQRCNSSDLDSVMSDTDKESLDIAMRLMNDEELDDLQSASADIHEDLRKWMLKRNYESLMEASEYLHKTLQEHSSLSSGDGIANNKNMSLDGIEVSGNAMNKAESKKSAAKRSLKNMQSKALAGLVIRRNITRLQSKSTGKSTNHATNI